MIWLALVPLWLGVVVAVGCLLYMCGRWDQQTIDDNEIAMRDEWIAALEQGAHVETEIRP